jgi:DNA-binding transcriptional ArsR family regulator
MYSTHDNAPCTFRVNLFKAPENAKKAKFLVEVQRRFGCVVVFRRFYQQFLQALATEGVAIPFFPLKPAATTDLQPSPSQVTLDKTSLDLLLRSLGNPSKFGTVSLETLRETLRVLANLSRTSQNKEVLVDAETDRSILFEILLSALKLPDGEVRRCSATLLNNIATLKTVRSELITKLATCMFQTLDNTSDVSVAGFMSGSLMEKESQRQIAQALVMLTETHASEVVRQPNYPYFQEVLDKHKTSSDELLRESVQATITNLS